MSRKNTFLNDKILVCEDDSRLRENISAILELEGFQIYEASNGKEALQLLQLKRINLVIVDWVMPEITGIDLLKEIKANRKLAHIPVIMLTAKNNQTDKYEALIAMAEDYFTKPFDMKELTLKCKNLIANRKLVLRSFILEKEKTNYEPKDHKFITDIKEIINENLANEKLNLNDFIVKFNMSKSSFQKNVRRIFGKTIFDIVIETRLIEAKEILEQDAMSVAEVVVVCGFKNHNFFTRKFKEKFGILPSRVKPKTALIK
jgi:DNA-binding response OmpR family regulator